MHSFFNVSPITELLNSIVRSIIFKLSRLASKSVEPFKTCEFSKKKSSQTLFIHNSCKNLKNLTELLDELISNMKSYRFGYKSLNYENQNLFRADFINSDPDLLINFWNYYYAK